MTISHPLLFNVRNVTYIHVYKMWINPNYMRVMVFNATFKYILVMLWQSVLLMKEIRVPGDNHRLASSQWLTLSLIIIGYTTPWVGFELTTLVVINTCCIGSCKSNNRKITTTTAPKLFELTIIVIIYCSNRNKQKRNVIYIYYKTVEKICRFYQT